MKKLTFLLTMMLFAFGIGNAWAETVTFNSSNCTNWTSSQAEQTQTIDGITLHSTSAANNTQLRLYSGGTHTFTSTVGNITSILFTCTANGTSNYGPGKMTGDGYTAGTAKTGEWTGNSAEVVLTGGQSRCTSIVVTYTPSGSGEGSEGEGEGEGGETPEPEEGETVTYVFKDDPNCPANGVDWLSGTIDEYSGWTATKGGTNNPKYYTTGTGLRVYSGGKFTITSTKTMVSITLTFSGTGYTFSSTNTTNPQTVTPNATSYEWSVGRTCRLQKIEITYAAETGGAESVTVTDAQLAWSAATAEATMPSTFDNQPTLTNTLGLDVTYSSSTPATATIAADGTITLVAAGETTISATFAGGEVGGTTYAAKTVSYTLTVNKAPAVATGTTYVKVTDAAGITNGEYLIVYEDGNFAFDGSLAELDAVGNIVEVAIESSTIAGNTYIDAAVFTIDATAGTILSASGNYIGQESDANGLASSTSNAYTNTISIETDGSATIISGGAYLRYNSASNQRRFRYYKSSSYSGQKAIALYKNTDGQQLAGLAYATTKYLTKLGDAFATPTLTNPNSLTVTYSSNDNNVATVAADGAVTVKAAGVVTITASFAGNSSFLEGSATYTICVTEHAGTEADPYSVADARRVIDVMETAEGVYATGVVSEIVTAYNSQYGNISYNISVDGTTGADQLLSYRGKSYNGDSFASADDVKVGDEVVVKGNLKKYNTTYEFDENNQLVSLNRTKQQAGLAYEDTELTANVGEDFTEPTLTNPNNLTVTYSSSNTALATVDASTGEVTILTAGKVTITASTAGNASYAAGSASYNITIINPGLAVATLPFYFDGKRADIEGTAGMTHEGIDSDYSAKPYLKFNTAGDWAIVQFDSEPGEFSFLLKQNGNNAGTFTVYESENGVDYTSIWSGGDLGGNGEYATFEPTLSATARYVKFEYTTKGASTNYGLGEISIKKADHRQEAELAWNPATVSLTVGDAFTAPTFSNPNSLAVSFESSNTELATVDAGVISLVSGKTGTATITASFAGNEAYRDAEVTCTISVNPVTDDVVILAQHNGQWYAMMAQCPTGQTKRLAALPVEYINGTLYNVSAENQALITWSRAFIGNQVAFQHDGNYLKGVSSTDLILEADETGLYLWDKDNYTMQIGTTTRTFLYSKEYNCFRNYSAGGASDGNTSDKEYSSFPIVTAPNFADAEIYTRSVTAGNFGTICLPYGSSNYAGATFYEVIGNENDKVYLQSVLTLEAGMPYIFQATAGKIAVVYEGSQSAASNYNGLYGTFAYTTVATGHYIVYNNELRRCGTGCYVDANRAYLNLDEVPNGVPAQVPGRQRISMTIQGENAATGLDNITEGTGTIAPAMEGVYDIMGRKLTEPTTTGFYIINGKKVFVVK